MSIDWMDICITTGDEDLRSLLYRLYVKEKRSTHEMEKILGVSYITILRKLKDVGIKTRQRGGQRFKYMDVSITEEEFLTKTSKELQKEKGCSEYCVYTRTRQFKRKKSHS